MPTNQQKPQTQQKPQSQQANKPQSGAVNSPGQTQQRQGSTPSQSTDRDRDFSRQGQK